MKYFQIIASTLIGVVLGVRGISQDSLYAKRIDSLWLHSHDSHLLSKKRATIGKAKIQFAFYKSSGKMRSVVSLNRAEKENLIFFYLEDNLVMISPSGQQPYFILNDKIAFARQLEHSPGQIQEMIVRAYNYLALWYKKIKDQRD